MHCLSKAKRDGVGDSENTAFFAVSFYFESAALMVSEKCDHPRWDGMDKMTYLTQRGEGRCVPPAFISRRRSFGAAGDMK